MHLIAHNCKICGAEMRVRCDESCPPGWIDMLVPMAACNACYDNHAALRAAEDRIRSICWALFLSARPGFKLPPGKSLESFRSNARNNLTHLTMEYCRRAAVHYGAEPQWADEFVSILVEKCHESFMVLRYYERDLVKMGNNPVAKARAEMKPIQETTVRNRI